MPDDKSFYDVITDLPKTEAVSSRKIDNPYPPDVPAAFAALPRHGSHLRAWCDDKIVGFRYVDFTFFIHFQGIQRIINSNYLVISGGDEGVKADQFTNDSASHLFLIQMGTRPPIGPWMSNMPITKQDLIIQTIVLDNEKWHAGGISMLGHILAVPIYGKNSGTGYFNSEIVFLDMSFPTIPKLFPFRIKRPKVKAGAVSLTRLPNKRFVCAVWSDDDKKPRKAPRLDFYISRDDDFYHGFRDDVSATWYASEVKLAPGTAGRFSEYQAINFVTQKYDDQNPYKLFLIGTERKKDSGDDTADLHSVEFPPEVLAAQPQLKKPVITKQDAKHFICTDAQGQFDAANGIHLEDDGRIHLYSAYYWRIDNMIRFTEFAV